MGSGGDGTQWVMGFLNLIIMLSIEHWVIASLLFGGFFYLLFTAINEQAKTDLGAMSSGITAIAFASLFWFGVLASVIGIIKFLWINV